MMNNISILIYKESKPVIKRDDVEVLYVNSYDEAKDITVKNYPDIFVAFVKKTEDIELIKSIKSINQDAVSIISTQLYSDSDTFNFISKYANYILPTPINIDYLNSIVDKEIFNIKNSYALRAFDVVLKDMADLQNMLMASFKNLNGNFELEFLNKDFLKILAYKSMSSFKKTNSDLIDYIQNVYGLNKKKKWLSYVKDTKNVRLTLKSSDKVYIANIISYDNINKEMLILREE